MGHAALDNLPVYNCTETDKLVPLGCERKLEYLQRTQESVSQLFIVKSIMDPILLPSNVIHRRKSQFLVGEFISV